MSSLRKLLAWHLPLVLPVLVAVAADAPGQSRRKTIAKAPPFVVHCHFRDQAVADEVADIANTVWQIAAKHLKPTAKAEKKAAQRPLQVHVYRDPARYAAMGEKLKSDSYRDFPGFAHGPTMTCHALLKEDPWWNGDGLDPRSRTLLAHEIVHLAVYACCRSAVFHPQWFTEGIAQWGEVEVGKLAGWFADPEKDPYEGVHTKLAQDQLDKNQLPKVDAMLKGEWGELPVKDRYPGMRMLWLFLQARHPEALTALLATARSAEAAPTVRLRLYNTLTVRLGEEAWGTIENDFAAFVKEREIAAVPIPAMAPDDAVGQPGEDGFVPGSPNPRWLDRTDKNSFSLNAEVTIHPEGPRQTDLVLSAGALRVSLIAGQGIWVTARDDKAGPWTLLAQTTDVKPPSDRPFALRVTARRGSVTIALDGAQALRAATGKRSARGRWGVGGPAGSRASWQKLRLR